jgi:hypothetical protein
MTVLNTEYDSVWSDLYTKRIKLLDRRAELEASLSEVANQISHLNEILNHLEPLAGLAGGNLASMGITDAVRWVLSESEGRMSPTDVRDKLLENGFDMSSLTAPMSSIYKILSRLSSEKEPEVLRETDDDRKVYYSWIK